MKIEELRIGNYVISNISGKLLRITSIITENCIVCTIVKTKRDVKVKLEELDPIELTSKILEEHTKFKLDKEESKLLSAKVYNGVTESGNFYIQAITDDPENKQFTYINQKSKTWFIRIDNYCHDSIGSGEIKYVHEAQNLILTLIGEKI